MKILKFTAEWCSSCKAMSKIIEELPDKSFIHEINVESDEGDDLATKFKIKSLPTIVVLNKNDEEVNRFVGILSRIHLEDIIQKYGDN